MIEAIISLSTEQVGKQQQEWQLPPPTMGELRGRQLRGKGKGWDLPEPEAPQISFSPLKQQQQQQLAAQQQQLLTPPQSLSLSDSPEDFREPASHGCLNSPLEQDSLHDGPPHSPPKEKTESHPRIYHSPYQRDQRGRGADTKTLSEKLGPGGTSRQKEAQGGNGTLERRRGVEKEDESYQSGDAPFVFPRDGSTLLCLGQGRRGVGLQNCGYLQNAGTLPFSSGRP
eukprot:Cvel_3804.t1-p1 / transcript=Cvel_3804.t1 / gene=Cvel_3804 / organism=Chromera_velia_CCMP2878 / gene_product=hypothetical protein / transcript_product=hypothetical protein / location=Cvel_scaffold160:45000-45677(+) / protein_length=226 / sequence_SO=supercontig / SO=protein_coding / is_pseudo=false